MKNLKQLYSELSSRTDFIVDVKGFDGGRGYFISGSWTERNVCRHGKKCAN